MSTKAKIGQKQSKYWKDTTMYRIGLTGGVGSGKSTVSSYMKEFGIPVIDGDCLAMEAVAPGNIAMREIRQVFGNGIFNEDGSLNRLKTADEELSHAANKGNHIQR